MHKHPIEERIKDEVKNIIPVDAEVILAGVNKGLKRGKFRVRLEKFAGGLLSGLAACVFVGVCLFIFFHTGFLGETEPLAYGEDYAPPYEEDEPLNETDETPIDWETEFTFPVEVDKIFERLYETLNPPGNTPKFDEDFETIMRQLGRLRSYQSNYSIFNLDVCPNKGMRFDVLSVVTRQNEVEIVFSMRGQSGHRLYTSYDQEQGHYIGMGLNPVFSFQICRGICASTPEFVFYRNEGILAMAAMRACVPEGSPKLEKIGAYAHGVFMYKARYTLDEPLEAGDVISLCIYNESFLYVMAEMFSFGTLGVVIPPQAPTTVLQIPGEEGVVLLDILRPHFINYRNSLTHEAVTPVISSVGIVNGRLHIQTYGTQRQYRFMQLETPDGRLVSPVTIPVFDNQNGNLRYHLDGIPARRNIFDDFDVISFYAELIFDEELDMSRLGEYRVVMSGSMTRHSAHRSMNMVIG